METPDCGKRGGLLDGGFRGPRRLLLSHQIQLARGTDAELYREVSETLSISHPSLVLDCGESLKTTTDEIA